MGSVLPSSYVSAATDGSSDGGDSVVKEWREVAGKIQRLFDFGNHIRYGSELRLIELVEQARFFSEDVEEPTRANADKFLGLSRRAIDVINFLEKDKKELNDVARLCLSSKYAKLDTFRRELECEIARWN